MILQKIQGLNEDIEFWWDSLPDCREYWKGRILAESPPERRCDIESELGEFFGAGSSRPGILRGATSNPRLAWESIDIHRDAWASFVAERGEAGDPKPEAIYWDLYKKLYADNARLLLPEWERSAGRFGWICAQVLPDSSYDPPSMLAQGKELAALGTNVMVKIPGTSSGFEAIEELTSRGIATNCTLSISTSQAALVAAAVDRGRLRAAREGTDLSRWRAVATFMAGRLGAEEALLRDADDAGMRLSQRDIRRIELLVLNAAYRVLSESGAPVKLLVCSLRADSDGSRDECLHIEGSAGAACIYTLAPSILGQLLRFSDINLGPSARSAEDGAMALDRYLSLPYVREAYEASGAVAPGAFDRHPAVLRALGEAMAGRQRTLAFIVEHMASV